MRLVILMLVSVAWPRHVCRSQGNPQKADGAEISLQSKAVAKQSIQRLGLSHPLKGLTHFLLAFNAAGTPRHFAPNAYLPVSNSICTRSGSGSEWDRLGYARQILMSGKPACKFDLSSVKDDHLLAAAKFLCEKKGGVALAYLPGLLKPGWEINQFSKPEADHINVFIRQHQDNSEGPIVAVAQLMRARLTDFTVQVVPDGEAASRDVAWIQTDSYSQNFDFDNGQDVIHWFEEKARAEWGEEGVNELWLAISATDERAIVCYESLGYMRMSGRNYGSVLMRKYLLADMPIQERDVQSIVLPTTLEEPQEALLTSGLGWGPFLSQTGKRMLVFVFSALAVFLFLTPLGGPRLSSLIGINPPWNAFEWTGSTVSAPLGAWQPIIEISLGFAITSLQLKLIYGVPGPGVTELSTVSNLSGTEGEVEDGGSEVGRDWFDCGPVEAQQLRPHYSMFAGEGRLVVAACAILAYELATALSEETLYRGFVESGSLLLLSPVTGRMGDPGIVTSELVALLVTTVLFGYTHTKFSSFSASPGESRMAWFLTTSSDSLIYSGLYIFSGHRLLAPVFAHAAHNFWLDLRRWGQMRRTPDEVLQRIFGMRM